MFFKLVLLGIALATIIYLFPRVKLRYRLHKELRIKEKREKAFSEKMKKLEIK